MDSATRPTNDCASAAPPPAAAEDTSSPPKLEDPEYQLDTYNLTVDDLHTYFVRGGHVSILVHNDNLCLTPGRNFKDHFLSKKGLLSSVTGRNYRKLDQHGPEFLRDLDDLVNSGDLEFVGYGTFKAGQPSAKIYRGKGITLITTVNDEFWTLLKTGEGMDKAIVMLPHTLGY